MDPRRTLGFFAWFVGGALGVWLLGIVITLPLLVLLYAWVEGRGSWKTAGPLSAVVFLLIWGVFEYTMEMKWPAGALLGYLSSNKSPSFAASVTGGEQV